MHKIIIHMLYVSSTLSHIQAFTQEVTAKQPDYDRVMAEGQNLLQLAHPRAVPVLQSHLQQLERAWLDLRGRVGEQSRNASNTCVQTHTYTICLPFVSTTQWLRHTVYI